MNPMALATIMFTPRERRSEVMDAVFPAMLPLAQGPRLALTALAADEQVVRRERKEETLVREVATVLRQRGPAQTQLTTSELNAAPALARVLTRIPDVHLQLTGAQVGAGTEVAATGSVKLDGGDGVSRPAPAPPGSVNIGPAPGTPEKEAEAAAAATAIKPPPGSVHIGPAPAPQPQPSPGTDGNLAAEMGSVRDALARLAKLVDALTARVDALTAAGQPAGSGGTSQQTTGTPVPAPAKGKP